MGIKNIITKIVACGATILSAVFYVLFQQSKNKAQEEKIQDLQQEKEEAEKKVEIVEAVQKAQTEEKKKYEETLQKATSGHKLSNYNAAMAILSDD